MFLMFASVFQLIIRAQDTSLDPKSATATVDVTIVRNRYEPQFLQNEYDGQDLEGAPLGETILKLSAIDNDTLIPLNRDVCFGVWLGRKWQ